jgi:hypothetical protein
VKGREKLSITGGAYSVKKGDIGAGDKERRGKEAGRISADGIG